MSLWSHTLPNNSVHGQRSPLQMVWVFQSAVIALTCGIGLGMIIQEQQRHTPPTCTRIGQMIKIHSVEAYRNIIQKFRRKELFTHNSFWLLVMGTCPHAWGKWMWYPLFLFCFYREEEDISDSSGQDECSKNISPRDKLSKNDEHKKDKKDSKEINASPTRTPIRENISTKAKATLAPEFPTSSGNTGSTHRYLEILVHNVSHADLVLGVNIPSIGGSSSSSTSCENKEDPLSGSSSNLFALDSPSMSSPPHLGKLCLCRPRFSAFDLYSRRILASLNSDTTANIVSFPRYERSDDQRYTIITPRPSRQAMLPTGFQLERKVASTTSNSFSLGEKDKLTIPSTELDHLLRFRGKDAVRIKPFTIPGNASTGINNHNQTLQQPREQSEDMPNEQILPKNSNSKTGSENMIRINQVFFPLLATLLPRWHQRIQKKYSDLTTSSGCATTATPKIKKVLVLVTGVGAPRNWTHSINGNSTEACAHLMEKYIFELYPDVRVVFVHSTTNIFRYDENIEFAKTELMPCIDSYRDAHACNEPYPDELNNVDHYNQDQQQRRRPNIVVATGAFTHNAVPVVPATASTLRQQQSQFTSPRTFDTEWKQSFSVTLSFADGTPARTRAIQASLRSYRPSYFHVWQLKTFWHDAKICEDDVEVHSFEDMETAPAMEVNRANASTSDDQRVLLVVEEMKQFRDEFLNIASSGRNDIRQFWLRKTRKPVLSVLLVEHHEKGPVLYRGTNMEVSMPTGSLCAERNVIGTALAANPGLKREDLNMIAVLAVPLPTSPETTPLVLGKEIPPCQELPSSNFVPERNGLRQTTSMVSSASIVETDQGEEGEWVLEASTTIANSASAASDSDSISNDTNLVKRSPDLSPALNAEIPPAIHLPPSLSPGAAAPKTPPRRIILYSSNNNSAENLINRENLAKETKASTESDNGSRKTKRMIIVQSKKDLNPLRPCGACNEWLKKISESNPYFKVLTFTDAGCKGVYASPCQE